MEDEVALKMFIHQMNDQAKDLNKNIVQKSATMQDIPVEKGIYKKKNNKANAQQLAAQQQMLIQQQQQLAAQQQVVPQQVIPQQQVTGDPALLNNLIERVSSVEKQLTKFLTLIERRLAKNAKEINIRIKLNEDNDSTNKE